MTHDEYQEQISQLIDGELKEQSQPNIFLHLAECIACRGFLRQSLQLRDRLSAQMAVVPASLDERMQSLVEGSIHSRVSKSKSVTTFWRRRLALPLPLAATILLILTLGGIVVSAELTREKPKPEVLYVPTMPTIEVQGYYFKAGN